MAVGAHDSWIMVYDVPGGFKKKGVCKGHHSTITHIDFSVDGQVLQSNCTSYELLYFNMANFKQNPSGASANKDEKWATWTCVIGWPVQGIFPPFADGSDVNSCDRSKDGKLIATADDFGKVKLFKYPCAIKDAQFQKFIGHSSHVTQIRFSELKTGRYAISTGGNDKAIFQWKVSGDDEINNEYDDGDFDESEFKSKKEDNPGNSDDPNFEKPKNTTQQLGLFQIEEATGGDQCMAIKPWLGEVKNSWPTDYKMPPNCNDPPTQNLEVLYVHGYRSFDARMTAKWIHDTDNVCFVSAAQGVTMKIQDNTQEFFKLHDEDLVSFDLHPTKKIAASGSMPGKGIVDGKAKAKFVDIYVWEVESKKKQAHQTGFHRGSIKILKFSPDGTKLASFGEDDDNSLALYDWENERLICTSKVDKASVLGCGWNDDKSFCTVGQKHMKQWTLTGNNVSSRLGSWGRQKGEPQLEAVFRNGTCFTAGWKGSVWPWANTSLGKPIQAHDCIYTMQASPTDKNVLYTGGKDGLIKVWNCSGQSMTCTKTAVDLSKSDSQCPGIRNIDVHPDGTILAGTKGSELYKVTTDGKYTKFLTGHYDGELWGCATSPDDKYYATSGGDNTIRIWDVILRKQVAVYKHKEDVRAVDWAKNGEFVLGGDGEGNLVLLHKSDWTKAAVEYTSTFRRGKQWIEDVKISPDSTMAAFGTHMGVSKIEVVTIEASSTGCSIKKKGLINVGFTTAQISVDWSKDSQFIVSNSQAGELKWANIPSLSQVYASGAKDIDWETWTCKFGWPVQGIFPGADTTDVNCVARAQGTSGFEETVMATGDDFQKVCQFKYPSVKEKSGKKEYTAHASHVTRVRWMLNNNYLISTGGNDKVNIIWKTDFGGECKYTAEIGGSGGDDDEFEDFSAPKVIKDKYTGEPPKQKEQASNNTNTLGGGLFQEEVIEGGDEFMAVKPWLGAIKDPSSFTGPKPGSDKEPQIDLKLHWVHGFRAKDCRQNIYYNTEGSIVTHAAAVGITQNITSMTQKHHTEHIDDIMSFAQHPDCNLYATGEIGPKPHIFIWDSREESGKQTVVKIRSGIKKGVASQAFSPDGKYLASSCMDDTHLICIFGTDPSGPLLGSCKGGTDKIIGMAWKSNDTFVTWGIKHYGEWKFTGSAVSKGSGTPNFGKGKNIITSGLKYGSKQSMLHGASNGELQVWNGVSCGQVLKPHTACLDAIAVKEGEWVLTGGKDSMLVSHDFSTLKQLSKINVALIQGIDKTMNGNVRAIGFDANNPNKIALGLFSSEIYEVYPSDFKALDKATFKVRDVTRGHYSHNTQWTNEVWGLEMYHQDKDKFLTCSDDGSLRLWSISQKKQLEGWRLDKDANGATLPPDPKTKDLQESCKLRCVGIDYEDKIAVIGCKDGTVRFFDLKVGKQIKIIRDSKQWISDIRFSPNNDLVCIGSHDNAIYAYHYPSLKKQGKMAKHSSFITHIDWSKDGSFLHSNCGAYELLFWDVRSCKQMTSGASALKDEEWETWTCVLGWPVQGIFRANWDGSDVNMVDRSHLKTGTDTNNQYQLLCTADDFSNIRIYRYPCLKKDSDSSTGYGHSSHVTSCRFEKEDKYVISTGGEDQTVMVWSITHHGTPTPVDN